MSRLIDADALRAAVMKILNNSIGGAYDGLYQCLEVIDNAPTVCNDNYSMGYQDGVKKVLSERPQGEWILIAERLPDYMEEILITFQKPNREPLVYRAVFIGGKFAFDNGDTWNWNDSEIKAWMPLPLPYEQEDNENDYLDIQGNKREV